MKKNFKIICMILVFAGQAVIAADSMMSFAKSMGSASFWQGMGRTFGAAPVGYDFSYQVLSDANVPIYVAQEGMASFMGAAFTSSKGLYNKKMLPSIFQATTGESAKVIVNGAQYYFNLYIGLSPEVQKSFLYQEILTQVPLKKHDPSISFYHVYTGKHFSKGVTVHKPAVEMLGVQGPATAGAAKTGVSVDNQLSSLVFYNSSGNRMQVSLNYGKTPCKLTLEKYSFNTLNVATISSSDGSSKPSFSLRPNTLSFSIYNQTSKKYEPFKNLILPSDGLSGYAYTIELFDDGQGMDFCIQGLSAGNYDQMISPRVRDVTPCPCTLWYQSVAQAKSAQGYVDLPGQVWVAYKGTDSIVISKVVVGQAAAWNLVRPLIDQHDEYLYFIYVATLDDAKAKKFVEQVVHKTLGKSQIAQYDEIIKKPIDAHVSTAIDLTQSSKNHDAAASTITLQQENKTLSGSLALNGQRIEDTVADVYGYIIGIDIFTPKGLGNGDFYYLLAPSMINIPAIVQFLSGCIDTTKLQGSPSDADTQTLLTSTVTDWLQSYLKDAKAAADKIQQFFITSGNKSIVDGKGALTSFGQSQLKLFLQGPVSIKYPPMKLSVVTNMYVYDFGKTVPKDIPDTIVQLPLQDEL